MSDQEPVAWLVLDAKLKPFHVRLHRDTALGDANECSGIIFPLYRHPQPTLTDEERESLKWYAARNARVHAARLRGLLERLVGER